MTVKIHGKDYVEVNERIEEFKKDYPDGKINTEILEVRDDFILMKAYVYKGAVTRFSIPDATGHAFENRDSSKINKTSYIENCETSAIGRALGILGYGITTSIASAEEVTQAIEQQGSEERATEKQVKFIKQKLNYKKLDKKIILDVYKIENIEDVAKSKVNSIIKYIDDYKGDTNADNSVQK